MDNSYHCNEILHPNIGIGENRYMASNSSDQTQTYRNPGFTFRVCLGFTLGLLRVNPDKAKVNAE